MVYRGKPSKGCAQCRARKTKCDGARPACSQCQRAGRICTGYRDVDALMVVDQSLEVFSKAARSRGRHTTPDSGYGSAGYAHDSPGSSSDSSENSLDVGTLRNFPEPTFWVESYAKSVFFSEYINVASGHLKTDLMFVPTLQQAAPTDGMLENIISALGIAVLRRKNHSLSYLGAQKYSSALRQTQIALKDAQLVKSDETLATVLLLGLHELVAVDDPDTDLPRSSVHLDGAIRLLQLRDNDQIDRVPGARMFFRVYVQVLQTCLYARQRIPTALLELQEKLRPYMNEGEAANADLFKLTARLCDVLVRPCGERNATETLEVLGTLQTLDSDLLAWKAGLHPWHNYQKHPIPSPDKSFLTHHDVYINHLSAGSWNRYRCIRICVHEEILSLLSMAASPAAASIATKSEGIIQEMSQDICHSVPFFLGQECTRDWNETPAPPPNMYGGAAMLMPLFFASNPERTSPAMHEWLVGQIGRIAKQTGIAKARSVYNDRISHERTWES